jgi:hypothetical protein
VLTPLTRPRAYLEAVTAGLAVAPPQELPGILREIARNLGVLAQEAEKELAKDQPQKA